MGDRFELTSFRVDAVLGVLASEQHTPQPIDVELALELDLEVAGDSGDLSRSVDYAAVHRQVSFLLRTPRWRLLETFALAICRLLLAPPAPSEARAHVRRVELALRKPTILDGAVPGIRVARDTDWVDLEARFEPPGSWLEVLAETPWAGAYRVLVDAGTAFRAPPGACAHVIAGAADVAGHAVGASHDIARGPDTVVWNRTDDPLTLLVVAQPPIPA